MYLAAVIIEIRPMVFPCPDQLQHIGRVSPEICELRTVIRMQQFPFPDGTHIKLLSFFRNREYRILTVATGSGQNTSPIPCDFIHIQQTVVCSTSHAKRQLIIDLFFQSELPSHLVIHLAVFGMQPMETILLIHGKSFPIAVASNLGPVIAKARRQEPSGLPI